MKKRIDLMPAPTAIQPGNYVRKAYEKTIANTPWIDISVNPVSDGWEMMLLWPCKTPVKDTRNDVNLFADAVAVLVPVTPQAMMMTMGDENNAVEGVMWRSDHKEPTQISAHGLGSVERSKAQAGMKVMGAWEKDMLGVKIEIPEWAALTQQNRVGVAVWQGANADRAGLKSVTPDWINLS